MQNRRLGPGTAIIRRAFGLVFLVAIGCSQEEPLQPDPGVSPMYPGPTAEAKATEGLGAAGSPADRAPTGSTDRERPLRPEDVERELRTAMRVAEKGDPARAAAMLDRILVLEPVNREALLGRASLALDQARKAATPEERAAAVEKAGSTARTLRRAYERPNSRELDLYSRVFSEQVRTDVAQGQYDRAVSVLREAHQSRYDPFRSVEKDPEMAKLRAWPGYQALVREIEAENLARARARMKGQLDRRLDLPLDFKVEDLDGKPLSVGDLKGKVVMLDFWGTWCKPCVEAIPALAQLYERYHAQGLEIIGLDYEQNAPDPETAKQHVKRFVKESRIPYHIAIGDPALLEKLNVQAYPHTILVDRSGKARVVMTGGGPDALETLASAVLVLLNEDSGSKEPAKPAAEPRGAAVTPPAPKGDTKGTNKPK
jgi:thiol-disulfide isomerase/thioredoxin